VITLAFLGYLLRYAAARTIYDYVAGGRHSQGAVQYVKYIPLVVAVVIAYELVKTITGRVLWGAWTREGQRAYKWQRGRERARRDTKRESDGKS
jgi:hypothetical protein